MPAHDKPPFVVMQVASVEFDLPTTGILYLPELEGFSLIGRVYGDLRKSFADGRLIRTSTVIEFHEDQGYQIAQTSSGSRYVLVSATGSDVSGLFEKQFGFSRCN
ncbi:hypothetical protein ALO70_200220 [Pseudomonas amygdali pv. eriobotryae]|uniref:Uncharacterized protein n=1 Tax=Pseudomonas amygdali pv. eriobotryae TaxID=129137 RepID=A0A0P9S5L8_PSEA0|nr:hypothetical protein [Pseudomonas amygdali]KPX20984.1 hypothetical protein ALO70_200220 [Pseudomonas amygdali pv. eriobotryae]KWS78403.1 hypothetical protein AL052_01345 [Pseudomonas amygdali pv. eriobotryae]GFZ73906.1 hypothetical protein PSE10C_46480 [Pseudomonas amygdali pv. eriobotryae]